MPAPLAFHVLGPLQVTQADAPVVLGGPRERVLLAALLVEHGRVVSVDGLSQALWGDRPPATARHQVAIGVSRLRKAFAAAGAGPGVIATCAPGYLVAGGWLDARCFEEHARRAHDALAAGDREEAAGLLRAGLALWRGPALCGIDRPFAEIEAARLEEGRLLLVETLGVEPGPQLRAVHQALLRDEPAGHLDEPAWHQGAPPRPQGGP